MKLVVIGENIEDNSRFVEDSNCQETLARTISYFEGLGYALPWVGYYALIGDEVIGTCAFKGGPINGKVEIAYVTFDQYRGKGYGTEMCRDLVRIGQDHNAAIQISARTLREKGHSTRILEKNGFSIKDEIIDLDGAPVWEWIYNGNS